MTMRRLHRALAALLGVFLTLHLVHHATLLGGTATHLAVQAVLSPLYRWLPLEGLLLTLMLVQIGLGVALARRLWARSKGWRRVQIVSGGMLAAFILVHVAAVLTTRAQGLDTTVHFAAAGLYHPLWRWFFLLYYLAGLMALVMHLASHLALRRLGPAWLPMALVMVGAAYAALVVLGLTGVFGGPPPPPDYRFA